MIAAIYARKSTEQTGVADELKSVGRQIEGARAYATKNGWTVDDRFTFVDDGISGAEFESRPGFVRLMASLGSKKQRPPFQVLIMSEESRLGREMTQTMGALGEIVRSGVRVFYYMDDKEATLNSPIEKAMMMMDPSAQNWNARRRASALPMRCCRRPALATSPAVRSLAMTT
jgi:DNA invertase Pin-like site-specific DNA recombinase